MLNHTFDTSSVQSSGAVESSEPARAAEASSEPDYDYQRPQMRIESGPIQVRRWDGATTNRLNKDQFAAVTGRSINEDLASNLRPLIDRCSFEATANSVIEGMALTHGLDIVGADGPGLQVLPRRPIGLSKPQLEAFATYCVEAEEYLEDWAEFCTYNDDQSFVDVLTMAVQALWTAGNSFNQTVSNRSHSRGVGNIRLHPIHAQRVLHGSHYQTSTGEPVVLGIQRDSFGKPLRYWVQEAGQHGGYTDSSKFTEVAAENMLHHFTVKEPGQIAGVPLLASALPAVGDQRQFSKLTMEAAKVAAASGLVFQDKFETSPRIKGQASGGNFSVKMAAASMMTAPPGKEVKTIQPAHPGAQFDSYDDRQWRNIARAASMPLMIARLDASNTSYASARIESQLYMRSIKRDQSSLRRRFTPLLMDVLREAELSGAIPMRPVPIQIGATWQQLAHVDESKNSKARQIDLKTMSTSLLDVWQQDGKRGHVQIEKMRRQTELLDTVKPGLGSAYLTNLLSDTQPDLLAQFEDLQADLEDANDA